MNSDRLSVSVIVPERLAAPAPDPGDGSRLAWN
jgi:hypothetical protein